MARHREARRLAQAHARGCARIEGWLVGWLDGWLVGWTPTGRPHPLVASLADRSQSLLGFLAVRLTLRRRTLVVLVVPRAARRMDGRHHQNHDPRDVGSVLARPSSRADAVPYGSFFRSCLFLRGIRVEASGRRVDAGAFDGSVL